MVDVDSVLLSVQERDKWRRRMDLLVRSLEEVRERRVRAEERLRRIKQQIARLRTTGDAMVDMRRRPVVAGVSRGATSIPYTGR